MQVDSVTVPSYLRGPNRFYTAGPPTWNFSSVQQTLLTGSCARHCAGLMWGRDACQSKANRKTGKWFPDLMLIRVTVEELFRMQTAPNLTVVGLSIFQLYNGAKVTGIQYASQPTMRLCEINPSLIEDTVNQKCTFDLQCFQLRRGHRLRSISTDS